MAPRTLMDRVPAVCHESGPVGVTGGSRLSRRQGFIEDALGPRRTRVTRFSLPRKRTAIRTEAPLQPSRERPGPGGPPLRLLPKVRGRGPLPRPSPVRSPAALPLSSPTVHRSRGRSPRASSPPRRHTVSVPSVAALVTALLVGLSIPFAASSGGGLLNSRATELIRHLQEDLPSIRETIRKLDEAPESGTFVIWDKEAYQDDLNGHLDDALSILLPESYLQTRESLQEIDESLEELRTEESKLEAERALEAIRPTDEPGVVGRVVEWLTYEDIDDRIRDLRAKTAEQERKRVQLLEDFRDLVREELGLELARSDIEALLYQVNGADLMDGIVVAKVLTRVEAHIRDIIAEATGVAAPDVRLQYYGFALVVRLIVERLHARHLENYDTLYLTALDELERENQEALRENESTLAKVKSDEQRRVTVETNIRLLGMARRAIVVYRDLLERRREKTNRMLSEAHKDALVARGTLRTLEMVMNLEHVASKALAEFAALSEVSSPDLLPLDDQELYGQFLDISKTLSAKRKG